MTYIIWLLRLVDCLIKMIIVSHYVVVRKFEREKIRLCLILLPLSATLVWAVNESFVKTICAFIIYLVLIDRKDGPWYGIFSYVFAQAMDNFIGEIANQFTDFFDGGTYATIKTTLVSMLISIPVIFLLCILLKKFLGIEEEDFEIGIREYISLILAGVVMFFAVAGSRIVLSEDINFKIREAFVLSILVLIIFFMAMFLYQNVLQNRKKYYEKLYLCQKEMETERKRYEEAQLEQFEKVKEFKHNNEQRIKAIRGMNVLNSEAADRLIDEMNDEYEEKFKTLDCGNLTVSSLLLEYGRISSEKGIAFSWKGHVHGIPVFTNLELADCLGNMLKNAVEECERIDSSEKYIEIEILMLENAFAFTVSNPTDKKDTKAGYVPETEKEDKTKHGMGIKSIRKICEGYDNSGFTASIRDGCFRAGLVVPLR